MTDRDTALVRSDEPALAQGGPAPRSDLIHSGAALVVISEELHLRLLRTALGFAIATALADTLLAGLNPGQSWHGGLTLLLTGGCIVAAAAAFRHPATVYLSQRRHPALSVLPALIGCALLVLDGPYGALWLLAVAAIAITSVTAPARVVLGLSVLASACYCAGTWLRGDRLVVSHDPSHIAAMIGLPTDGALAIIVVTGLGRFVLGLHRFEREIRDPPRPVTAGRAPVARPRARRPRLLVAPASRLTPRQLQVLALVRDGLHHPEIAACLGISTRQVERHLADARGRAGASTVAELIAMLVACRLFPAVPESGARASGLSQLLT